MSRLLASVVGKDGQTLVLETFNLELLGHNVKTQVVSQRVKIVRAMELALRHEPVHEQTHGELVQILEGGVILVEEAIVASLLSHNALPEGTLLGQNGSLDIELSLGLADMDGSPVMARCVDSKVVGLNPVDRCRQCGVLGLGLHVAWRKRDETGTGCRGHGGVDRRAGRCHWSWGTWCRGRGWSWCGSGGSYASVRLRVAS